MKIIPSMAIAALVLSSASSFAGDATKKFSKMDADGNGGISAAEASEYYRALYEKKGKDKDPEKAGQRFMKKHDDDGNGEVSLEELSQ